MAQAHNIPVTIHDCTGPLTLFSGLQVSFATSNIVFQETVRAHIRCMYSELIDTNVVIKNGEALPPEAPGLGTNLLPELFIGKKHNYHCSTKK